MLMAEIMHQLIGSLSMFILLHPRSYISQVVQISSIHSSDIVGVANETTSQQVVMAS